MGITSQAPQTETRPVHTTLLQWVAPVVETPLLVDGEAVELTSEPRHLPNVPWCFIDSVGAILLRPADLWARRQGRVTTIWIDHGAAPRDASYAYAILPSVTVEDVVTFATTPPIQRLHHDAMAHVLEQSISGAVGAAFFTAGTAADFGADSPAIIYMRGDEESGAVAVQDAMHRTATLQVALPVAQASAVHSVDSGIEVVDGTSQLRLAVQTQLGRIHRAGWGETSTRLRSVARTDLADFYAFQAQVEADPERAIFTVHITDEPQREGYELQLEGRRGHLLHIFTEEDVLDRPAPGIVRYVWRHGQTGGEPDDDDQREGDFRLLLYTELKFATAYVQIPHSDATGQPHPSTLPPDANRKTR